ncbi:hypothetical protein JO41_02110 [Treponema sp. OMZ 838]|uniref:hypothetical protein n=1 Tax=Treponema sp. OMZ 838 TaxID=1539298 RepID=UPI00053012D8|nr:hypothetical protein [Treponema sp. OMZ 838]AIW88739.1 hypothetical protein JO41_02110 [Treponema sp. OMZ 838]
MRVLIDVRPEQLHEIRKDLKNRDCGISPETERILVCITQGIQKKCQWQKMEIEQFEQYYDEECLYDS